MTKAELRTQLAARLRALAPEQRAHASAAIRTRLRAHPAWATARLVCAFLPLPSEPQLAPLWEEEGAARFCFPRVVGDDVVLIHLADPEVLRRADWRFEGEEIAHAPRIDPQTVDLFLVPGRGFTPTGQRLGRGGGFYDRLLSRRSPASTALGVCFSCQIVPALPAEPHDLSVDGLIDG